ncbi:MAG: hypothetical protein U0Q03_07230 [Acidimicrobiales bacterium]
MTDAPNAPQPPDEGPSDRTTLTAVLDAYRASGFAGDFFAEEGPDGGAIVRCGRCASALDPRRLEAHSIRRLEGASDPADMMSVVATSCPVCGTDGTLVVGFGPMASAVDGEVFLAMRDTRGDDVLPPSVAPDEVAQPDGGHPRP